MERYVLDTTAESIEVNFKVSSNSESILDPNYNASTGHLLPIITATANEGALESAVWGLTYGPQTVHVMNISDIVPNPAFMEMLKTNACIIPVSGFYVWKNTVADPLPFFVRVHSQELLAVAGMWKPISDSRKAFVVLVREANVLLKPLGETMPCLLNAEEQQSWLQGGAAEIVKEGFQHNNFMPDMTVFRVPDLVNDLSNNSKELIQPIPKLRDED